LRTGTVFSSARLNALTCSLLLAVCMLLAYPVANEGYLDDFSYAATALTFARAGHVVYNGWVEPTTGWMIAWGALFIKLFGFSFFVLRMSILPFALASVFLFHRILDRFGVAQRNANIGALTLALSPIFFPLATSFMTDVPALFVVLLCFYMCQRAIAAASERATVLWLVSAAMLNVAGGTVRQAAWLGALAMVPSTGWYLRKRRGALFASLLSASISAVFVLALMHWFYSRPQYFVDPAKNIAHPHSIRTLLEEMLKLLLLVLLLALPMLAAWWPTLRNLPRASLLRASAILGLIALCLGDAARRRRLGVWGAPWFHSTLSTFPIFGPPNIDQLFGSSVRIPPWLGVALTVLTASAALLVAEQLYNRRTPRRPTTVDAAPGLESLLWVVGPFSLIYVLLLASRAENPGLSDRYALCLLPFAIALLLLLYQRSIGPVLPVVTVLVLAVFALDAVGDTHDYYADQRAGDTAIRELAAAGVPESSISQSLNRDAWLQVSIAGHMHWSGPAELDRGPNPPLPRRVPAVPCSSYIEPLTPVVQPEYYILFSPSPCLQPSRYPPISYTAWLPPFHRNEYIEQPRYTLP
jgi:hypothetical protein